MKRKLSFLFLLSLSLVSRSQSILTKSEALKLLMENNFDLKVADLNTEIANNNTGVLNSGYLPTLSADGNITYNIDNSDLVFASGSDTTINNAESDSRALNLNLNYVLFDGFNRKYSIERNRENLTLTQLNAQATLENTLITLFSAYYAVAQSQQALLSLKETLAISKDRLVRTTYGYDYGRNTRLDISNAEVDVNTDSINYLNAKQNLDNQIRNLNLILSLSTNVSYQVDTAVSFAPITDKDALIQSLLAKNTQIQLAKAGVAVSQYDNQISQRIFFPTISLNGGYRNTVNNFAPGNFLSSRSGNGLTYGASFTWNLFDGGSGSVASQNARVNVGIQETLLKQTTQQVSTDFENAWSDYQNRLFIVEAQSNNLDANQQNFDRTLERYKLGQVTSLDFRTAQRNLLQAEISLIEARFNAKIAELTIFQLVGLIQEAQF